MSYDLARLTRLNGIRRDVVLRPIVPPQQFATAYFSIASRILRVWATSIETYILPAYENALAKVVRDALAKVVRDDEVSNLEAALASAALSAQAEVLSATEDLSPWITRVESWHRQKWASVVRAGTKVDVWPFLDVNAVQDEVTAALKRNAALIRNLSDDLRRRVEYLVWDSLIKQTPRRELAAELRRELSVGRTRALFIATDQTTKISGQLDRLRQEEAGVRRFKWRTSEDDRVREEHVALNGKIFPWRRRPSEGLPGEPPRCRCKGQAVIELE